MTEATSSGRARGRSSSDPLTAGRLRTWRAVMVLIAVCGLALDQIVKALRWPIWIPPIRRATSAGC